jgi:signal transduction histidine kinase
MFMPTRRPELHSIVRAWPVQLALALIVTLLAGTIFVDLAIARRVASRTADLVENTQRSVELLEDLHGETFRFARMRVTGEAVEDINRRIDGIAALYDPIANYIGERDEWLALQGTINELRATAGTGHRDEMRRLADEIDARIDRLIAINREAAHANAAQIRAAHRQGIVADATVGAVVLALCIAVALVLRRMISRQRALFAAHIRLLGERNRELDLFAGRAAHDLRAPLSPIRGYADLLSTGSESQEEVQQMASRIRTAVDKMARVVDDMLELSRAGRPLPGRASPRVVGDEVLSEMEPELRNARVACDLPDVPVACAPGVLQQILRNLVGNAIKFRHRERPLEIRLAGRVLPHPAGVPGPPMVELAVQDNGVGMDEDLAAHVFEPYHRGRTDREVPGHGLGLAIVDRATDALGGTIELSSAPDKGCTITIRLPMATSSPAT